MDNRTLVFTGGGTGGHVYPGLAVAIALRDKAFSGRIAWIGSTKNSDREAVEAAGLDYFAIPSGKLRREFSLKNFADAFRVLSGYAEARRILKFLKPVFLFSKGGYVSVPPCSAAASLGIPYFTHESDLTPGLATRLNARRADAILLSYEQTREFLVPASGKKAVVMGNPVRPTFHSADPERGRVLLGVSKGQPIIFFLGGSQGARQINELVSAVLPRLGEATFVVHQAGDAAVSGGADKLPPVGSNYRRFTHIGEEMPDLLAAADLVVGRAGAGTLWECSALGKPMILVPLCGSGTRGDQVDNAALFVRSGAAISLVGPEATADKLVDEITRLLDDHRRRMAIGEAARALAGRDAAAEIARLILERIGEAQ